MISSATISLCNRYRYELTREWDKALPPMLLIMLNPSTADSNVNDPTITRCIERAKMFDCGSLMVGNLGAGRATKIKDWKVMEDPVGPENIQHLTTMLSDCKKRKGILVVGWGLHGAFRGLDKRMNKLIRATGCHPYCLGTTDDGQPRHPLYVGYSKELELFHAK